MDTYHAICDNVNPGLFTKAAQGEVEWTEPDLVRAMELWKSLFDEGIMQDGALGIQQYPEANNLFMSQQAAMIMMGSWYSFNAIPENMKATMEAASSTDEPFTMIPIDFPDIAGTGNVGSLVGDLDYATAVSAKSENAEAATTFAVWLGASEEGQQIIADSLNMVPALKGITPNWDVVELGKPRKAERSNSRVFGHCRRPQHRARFADINADMNQAMMDVLAAVASGTMTPEDACASLAQSQAEFS